MDFAPYFKDKRVTVMGLGLLGRGIGDAAFLAECGAEVLVTDLKTEEELKEALDQLRAYENITFVLGEHRLEDFENRDMVLVAAGVPMESAYLAYARERGVRLVQSAALFAELSGIPIVGVTGTRGKSTVTHLIHHVLEHATGEKVLLGGNIRGVSNLQLLKEVAGDSLCVMELDSWQLQGWGWAGISPQVAVFTNFMEDHMTYYHGSMDDYFADKANIFLNQKENGILVTTPEVFDRAKQFASGKGITLGQEVVLADESSLPEGVIVTLPGVHNRQNAALAYETLRALSLNEDLILEGLATFPGVPGRLQFMGERKGVKIFNDNNATTPTATAAGLEAVADGKNVVLIAGGTNKDLDLTPLTSAIQKYVKHLVLYSGSGTEKLKELLPDHVDRVEYETLTACVEEAFSIAEDGDLVLFSPAFSSFGKEYKNEYDRNDKFVALIKAL